MFHGRVFVAACNIDAYVYVVSARPSVFVRQKTLGKVLSAAGRNSHITCLFHRGWVGLHVLGHVPRHMLRHMPSRHVPRYVPRHVLQHVPEYMLKQVPKHVLRPMPDKHVSRHVPKYGSSE